MVIGKCDYHRTRIPIQKGENGLSFGLRLSALIKTKKKRVIYTQNRIEMEFHAITQHFPRPVNSIAD